MIRGLSDGIDGMGNGRGDEPETGAENESDPKETFALAAKTRGRKRRKKWVDLTL